MKRRSFLAAAQSALIVPSAAWAGPAQTRPAEGRDLTAERMTFALLPLDRKSSRTLIIKFRTILIETGAAHAAFPAFCRHFDTQFNRQDRDMPRHQDQSTEYRERRLSELAVSSILNSDALVEAFDAFADAFYARAILEPELHLIVFPQGFFKVGEKSLDWPHYFDPPAKL